MEAKPTIPTQTLRISERADWGIEKNGAIHLSAQDMRDTHLVVVDDRREMVRGEEVRLEQYGISGKGRMSVAQAAEDEV